MSFFFQLPTKSTFSANTNFLFLSSSQHFCFTPDRFERVIKEAIEDLQRKTCLKFRRKEDRDENWIEFFVGSGYVLNLFFSTFQTGLVPILTQYEATSIL